MNIYKTACSCLLFFFFATTLVSQTIKGSVKDTEGNVVSNATFLIQKDKSISVISEYFTADESGSFYFEVKETYNKVLYISPSIMGYEKKMDSIVSPVKGNVYTINFILSPRATELEEVILVKERDFKIKKDTVVFNPEAYKDGTEDKVEDLLKKIPGLEVSDNGSIKYRGKEILEMQLDGDDLFGSNYTIGSKNISVDIIDEIEAIENFSRNPLLKGVENSNNVAINLKLKKGKTDYSGNSKVGLGYGNKARYDISANLLGISKQIKSFGVFSFNNIGLNKSSFDYFSTDLTIEELLNQDFYGKKNINVYSVQPSIGDARIRLNREWSGSYNLIHKISPKLRMRYNVFYVKDRLQSQNIFENIFFTQDGNVSFLDETSIVQKPEQGRLDIKADYNMSKKSLLEFESSISRQDIFDRIDFQRNMEEVFVSKLETEDFFWKNKLSITQKLNDALVFQYSSLYSRNNIPQSFQTDGDFILGTNDNSSIEQGSEFRKEVFQNHAGLLGKIGSIKYGISLDTDFYQIPFLSLLRDQNGLIVSDFQNDSEYTRSNYSSSFSFNYNVKKWRLDTDVRLNYNKQLIENNLSSNEEKSLDQFYPKVLLNVKYIFSKVSQINFKGGFDYLTPSENYLFSNNIVSSNRLITNNTTSLELLRKYDYRLSYRLDDLSKRIEVKANVGYSNIKDPFVSSFDISDDVTVQTNFQAPVSNDNLFSVFSISKYISLLRTTFVHTSSFTLSTFNNVINQSEFRENTSKIYTGDIFFKTSFALPINFENNLSYTTTSFDSSENFENINNSLTNTFRIIYKPNRTWVFSFFNYYFIPDLNNKSNSVSFLDLSLRYRSKKINGLSGSFVGKNLLNTAFFEQIDNTDFSTTVFQRNLIPRYLLLTLDFSF